MSAGASGGIIQRGHEEAHTTFDAAILLALEHMILELKAIRELL